MQKIFRPDNPELSITFSPLAQEIIRATGFQTFHATIGGKQVLVGFVAVHAPEACPK